MKTEPKQEKKLTQAEVTALRQKLCEDWQKRQAEAAQKQASKPTKDGEA